MGIEIPIEHVDDVLIECLIDDVSRRLWHLNLFNRTNEHLENVLGVLKEELKRRNKQ